MSQYISLRDAVTKLYLTLNLEYLLTKTLLQLLVFNSEDEEYEKMLDLITNNLTLYGNKPFPYIVAHREEMKIPIPAGHPSCRDGRTNYLVLEEPDTYFYVSIKVDDFYNFLNSETIRKK